MKHSESMTHMAPAFVEICGALSNPIRNRTVTVKTSKGAYEFSYATLDTILDLIRPILLASKCALTQVITKSPEGVQVLESRIIHETGEWMASEVEIILRTDDPKTVASTITYYRRYTICSMLPIAGLEDDGGAGANDEVHMEGSSTKGLMTGKELSDKNAEEFFARDHFTIAVRDNNLDQWRGWMEQLIKRCGAPPLLVQLWNDNQDTLANINPAAFNRLQKLRNNKYKEWGVELPAEYSDTPVPEGKPTLEAGE